MSESLEQVLRGFFHDQQVVRNLSLASQGKPNTLLREGEDIDVGQRAQRDANVEMLMERISAAGLTVGSCPKATTTPENVECPKCGGTKIAAEILANLRHEECPCTPENVEEPR